MKSSAFNAKPTLHYGASFDHSKLREIKATTSRPPLVHSNCFDQSDFEFSGKLPMRSAAYKQKPLLSDETQSRIEEEDVSSTLGSTKFLSKSDECCLLDQQTLMHSSVDSGDSYKVSLRTQFSIDLAESVSDSYERNYKNRANEYFYERAAAGPTAASNYEDMYENQFSPHPTTQNRSQERPNFFSLPTNPKQKDYHLEKEFRPSRLHGISHDPIKKQEDRVGSLPNRLQIQTSQESKQESIETDSTRLEAPNVPQNRSKLVKQNRVQRLSSSSLQVQTKDLSLSKLFDKRFGRRNHRLEKSKRLSTSALYDQSPTDEALYKSKSGSGRLSSIQLFEKFCSEDFSSLYGVGGASNDNESSETPEEETYTYYDNPTTSKSEDSVPHFNFYENPLERASVTALYERFCYSDTNHRHHSSSTSHETASFELTAAGRKHRDQDNEVFIFDEEAASPSETRKYSDTTPALSRGSETETSFNDDDLISSFNDDIFIDDMLMSPNLETLIEDRLDDDNSDPTQLLELDRDPTEQGIGISSDQYEPCLGFQPKRRSIKKVLLPNFKDRSWDLSNLDLRPIDADEDDDDDILSITPLISNINSKLPLANIDETNSIENSEKNTPEDNSSSVLKETPTFRETSRSSMNQLQPFSLKRDTEQVEKTVDKVGDTEKEITDSLVHLSIEPTPVVKVATQVDIKPDKSVFFRVRRDKQASAVTVHRKSKCFPL